MKKILIIVSGIGILGALAYCREAPVLKTNDPVQSQAENLPQWKSNLAGTVKEILDIQKKMSDIQRNIIQQDQELKQLAEQIRILREQMKVKLEDRLKDNEEYQALKQRREQIRAQYIKTGTKRIEKFHRSGTN